MCWKRRKERKRKEDAEIERILKEAADELRENLDREEYLANMKIQRLEKTLQSTFTDEQAELYRELAEAKSEYSNLLMERKRQSR